MRIISRLLLGGFMLLSTAVTAQTLQFARQLGSAGTEQANGVSTSGGLIYVGGSYMNVSGTPAQTDFDPGAATVNGPGSLNANQIWHGVYDASGNYGKVYTPNNNALTKATRAISADGSGNFAVTGGLMAPTAYFGNPPFQGPVAGTSGGTDIFIARYQALTNNFLWAFKIGNASVADEGLAVATDNSGNVYVTGYFQGTTDFNPDVTLSNTLTSAGFLDVFVVKFDAGGVFQWAISIGGTNSEKGTGIAVDASGNVYVTGQYTGTVDFDPTAATASLTEAGSGDVFVAKYNASGVYQWAISMGGIVGDQANAIATDGTNVYVTGYCQGFVDFDPGAGVLNYNGAGGQDIFVGKYSCASGALQWCNFMGGGGNEQGTGIAVDGSGNIFYSGFYASTVDFDPGAGTASRTSAGGDDIIFGKFNSSGAYQWANSIGGTGTDRANAIAADASGYIYLAGAFQGTSIDFDVTASTTALSSNGGSDIFFAKYSESICTAPSITTNPSSTTACTGGNASLTVAAGGTGPLNYQWQKNASNLVNGGNISGANSATLNISNVAAGDAGNYVCVVSGACAPNAITTTAVLTVTAGPSFTLQPSASTLCTGQTATFNVAVTGSGLTYKWQKNGTDMSNGGNVSGATSASLTITSVTASDAANYTCVVTSSCGNITSNTVGLIINAAPAITTHPASQSLCSGSTLNLNVAATGSGLTYQWRKNGTNMSDGGSVSGTSTASLTITSTVAGDAASYTCVVGGTCATSVTSNAAVVTIGTTASITTQPTNKTACAGTSATFTITASGSGYQWMKGGVPLSNGGNVSGATSATLIVSSVSASDVASYTCVISGCPSNITSTAATLTVTTAPSITTQPADNGICVGDNNTFTVVASGTGPLTYQWKKGSTNLTDGGNISGSTTASLTISAATASDAAAYSVVVSGACTPTVTSNTATLYVGPPPVITSQPSSQTACSGQTATFTIVSPGAGSYQWQKNGVNLSDVGNISGSSTSTLTISNVSITDADNYTCIATGCASSVTSNVAALTVGSAISITGHPADATLCAGANATFTVTVSGSGISYQWQKDGSNISNGGNISGATTASLTLSAIGLSDAGAYRCVITSSCGSTNSNAGQLSINTAPSISTQPTSQSACTGNALNLSVSAVGTGLTYQWQKNGVDVSTGTGGTTANYSIASVSASDAGDYTCIVSGTCSPSVTSSIATVTIISAPTITTQPTSQTACVNTSTSFTIVVSGSVQSYQWQKNGTNVSNGGTISGATTATLSISSLVAGDAGNYTCIVTSTCATTVTSSTAVLTVGSSSATITGQPVNATVCLNQNAAFFCNVSGSGVTFQWQKNGVNLTNGGNISGATNFALQVSAVTSSDVGAYRCLVTSGSCSSPITSNAAGLIIASPVIQVPPFSSSVCSGSMAYFDVVASGTSLTYQWKKDGVNLTNTGGVTGATTSGLRINNASAASVGDYTCMINSSVCPPAVTTVAVSLSVSACTDAMVAEGSEIIVYPNPSAGQFHVKVIEHPYEQTYVSVYNAVGVKVWEGTTTTDLDINAENMPSGLYHVKATQGDLSYQTTIVINK